MGIYIRFLTSSLSNKNMLQSRIRPKPMSFMQKQRAMLRKAKLFAAHFLESRGINAISAKYKIFDYELLDAADHGHYSEVVDLLKKGADINAKDSHGDIPIIIALREGNFEICKFLLENGADIRMKNNKGMNAIILSSRIKHFAAASLFVEIWIKEIFDKDAERFRALLMECAGSK
jgi:ankyrin repeat protein